MGFKFTENQPFSTIQSGEAANTWGSDCFEYALGYWWTAFDDNSGSHFLRSADFITWETVTVTSSGIGDYPSVVANRAKTHIALYSVYLYNTAYISIFDGTSWTEYTLPSHVGMYSISLCLDSNGKIHAFMFAGNSAVPRSVKYCNNVEGSFTVWTILPFSTDNQAAVYNLSADMDFYDRWHLAGEIRNDVTQAWYLSYISGTYSGWDSSWDHIPYTDSSTNDLTLKVDGNGIVYVLHGACFSITLWYGYRVHWNALLLDTPEYPEGNAWTYSECSLCSWEDVVYYKYKYYHVDGVGDLIDEYTYVGGVDNTGAFGPIRLLNSATPEGTWYEPDIACNATHVAIAGSTYLGEMWGCIAGRSSIITIRSFFILAIGYQQWENYPDSPVLTGEYAFQFIVIEYVNPENPIVPFLYISSQHMYKYDVSIYDRVAGSANLMYKYRLINGVWVYQNSSTTYYQIFNGFSPHEASQDIYTDNTYSTTWFARTTPEDGVTKIRKRSNHFVSETGLKRIRRGYIL